MAKIWRKWHLHCSTFCSGNVIRDFLKNNKKNNYEKCLKNTLQIELSDHLPVLLKIYVKELGTVKLRRNWCPPIHFSIIYTGKIFKKSQCTSMNYWFRKCATDREWNIIFPYNAKILAFMTTWMDQESKK